MYQCEPTANKKQVYWKCALAAFLGFACFGVSNIKNIPAPAAWQLGTLVSFSALILLYCGGILKSYRYELTERNEDSPEFIITEFYGKRITVVCRVRADEILEVLPADKKTRTDCEKIGTLFVYAVPTPLANRRILKMQCGEKIFFVEIVFEERLFSLLERFKKQ